MKDMKNHYQKEKLWWIDNQADQVITITIILIFRENTRKTLSVNPNQDQNLNQSMVKKTQILVKVDQFSIFLLQTYTQELNDII